MPEQWYWKHHRDLLGPLETEVLERLIQQRRVGDRDQIRLTTSSEWLSGAEVKALFAGRDKAGNPSEVAAALLERTLHPQVGGGDGQPAGSVFSDAATGAGFAVRNALRTISGFGGPVSKLVASIVTVVLQGGLRVSALLMNRAVVLCLLAVAFNVVVFVQHRQGSDARNRKVLSELTAAWREWEMLVKATPDDRMAYRAAAIPKWDATLASLTGDARRESLPSSNPLAGSERQRSIAAARRSLIQAIHEFRRIVDTPENEDDAIPIQSVTKDFETYLLLARQVIENDYQFYRPKWQPQQSQRFQSEAGAAFDPWIVAVVLLDAGLLLSGAWIYLRRPRA